MRHVLRHEYAGDQYSRPGGVADRVPAVGPAQSDTQGRRPLLQASRPVSAGICAQQTERVCEQDEAREFRSREHSARKGQRAEADTGGRFERGCSRRCERSGRLECECSGRCERKGCVEALRCALSFATSSGVHE